MQKTLEPLAEIVWYQTSDLHNGEHAKDLAFSAGRCVQVLFPKDPLPCDAVALMVDLDHQGLDAAGRRQWLADRLATPPRLVTCVHSYDFEDASEAKNLLMGRQLDDVLLCRLLESLGGDDDDDGESVLEVIDDDEQARIRLGSDGGPCCD